MPYLRGKRLLGFVDGTITAPDHLITVTTEGGAAQEPNPAYNIWLQQDQMVLSELGASFVSVICCRGMGFRSRHCDLYAHGA